MALGALLAGCSDIYFDRRETIALGAGDAVAANEVEQMVDPWPPHSGNNNIAFNGEQMQRAVECYRTDKVIQPVEPRSVDGLGSRRRHADAVRRQMQRRQRATGEPVPRRGGAAAPAPIMQPLRMRA